MAYIGLTDFIEALDKSNELSRIKSYINPELEVTEITDRITKSGGKALLFENNGTEFPILINAFGSDRRMSMAIGKSNLDEIASEIESLFNSITATGKSFRQKLQSFPSFLNLTRLVPSKQRGRGLCQQVVNMTPDLSIFPILKCWPHDGGKFITLPMVHTIHPESKKTNVGMYRMQILDQSTTAMHWQRHKTGANHYEAWKMAKGKMPVTVALGGDPVYTYASTAPLPENIDEYMLAGFLRRKRVKLVKCLTNDLWVPFDADIIIEGYVDTSEEQVWEGPFGDHTGFYSLADWYPKFHVTCITYKKEAVYPATIVGIPPQEDAWLAKTTERIFLAPVRMTLQPEIEDFHMPDAGIAHNLVLVKIRKTYPGQGMKVISSLFGAGQMMFTKYIVVISGNINIRNYEELIIHIFSNVDLSKDLLFIRGPLDVLDHSSDNFSFGGKMGIDATIKLPEERSAFEQITTNEKTDTVLNSDFLNNKIIRAFNLKLVEKKIPVLIVSVNISENSNVMDKVIELYDQLLISP